LWHFSIPKKRFITAANSLKQENFCLLPSACHEAIDIGEGISFPPFADAAGDCFNVNISFHTIHSHSSRLLSSAAKIRNRSLSCLPKVAYWKKKKSFMPHAAKKAKSGM